MTIKYNHTEHTHNPTSAEEILPYIFSIVKPKSVLDVGCGNGSWLKACKKLGISNVFGVDGIKVKSEDLMILEDEFLKHDLTQSLKLDNKFDLAISLEVAEHLPENAANTFINTLTNHSSVVLFSAAIPEQGGQFHINEQWPEYWNKKFKAKGFQAFDILRDKFWDNDNVLWWYQQNMILFVKKEDETFSRFKSSNHVLSLVHPKLYNKKVFKPKFLNNKKEVSFSILESLKFLIK